MSLTHTPEQIAEHDQRNRAMEISCPFYAATLVQLRTIPPSWVLARDSPGGNRCALITSAHSPCQMEFYEQMTPEWRACPRNPAYVALSMSVFGGREAGRVVKYYTRLARDLNASAAPDEEKPSGMSREAATATREWQERFGKPED